MFWIELIQKKDTIFSCAKTLQKIQKGKINQWQNSLVKLFFYICWWFMNMFMKDHWDYMPSTAWLLSDIMLFIKFSIPLLNPFRSLTPSILRKRCLQNLIFRLLEIFIKRKMWNFYGQMKYIVVFIWSLNSPWSFLLFN